MDHFYGAAQTIRRAALVAHLGRYFVLLRQGAQCTRFINIMRERLLTINMLAYLDGHGGDRGMHVVSRRDIHGVD